MGDNPGEMRLSNAERQEALDALEEHVRTGRLDVDEYADRSAKATVATRRGELEPLFADLPAPHPSVLSRELFTPSITGPAPRLTPGQALASKAVPIAAVIALVLFFTVLAASGRCSCSPRPPPCWRAGSPVVRGRASTDRWRNNGRIADLSPSFPLR